MRALADRSNRAAHVYSGASNASAAAITSNPGPGRTSSAAPTASSAHPPTIRAARLTESLIPTVWGRDTATSLGTAAKNAGPTCRTSANLGYSDHSTALAPNTAVCST